MGGGAIINRSVQSAIVVWPTLWCIGFRRDRVHRPLAKDPTDVPRHVPYRFSAPGGYDENRIPSWARRRNLTLIQQPRRTVSDTAWIRVNKRDSSLDYSRLPGLVDHPCTFILPISSSLSNVKYLWPSKTETMCSDLSSLLWPLYKHDIVNIFLFF